MKRVLLVLALTFAPAGAVSLVYFTPLFAAPSESEELMPPIQDPAVITPDIPTFVTFTSDITDPSIKRDRTPGRDRRVRMKLFPKQIADPLPRHLRLSTLPGRKSLHGGWELPFGATLRT